MANFDGSNAQGARTNKEKGPHRAWSEREEEVLMVCLKHVIASSWKSENGMRPGYMKKLEIGLKKAFPGTDLKVDPHISSRIQACKRNYASLVTILNSSGVGFIVNGDNKVEADEEQWEAFIRAYDNAKKIRKRSSPLYEEWKEVFGKDRATGDVAEDVVDAVDTLFSNTQDASAGINAHKLNVKGKNHATHLEGDDTSVCQSSKEHTNTSRNRKKKKTNESHNNMCVLLEQIHRDTNATFQTIASCSAVFADLSEARKRVFQQIKHIPGLSSKDQFIICNKLILSPPRLEFFMGLSGGSRQEYVWHMRSEAP